jgi:hypothetical protein
MLSIRGVPIPFTARSLAVLALIASVPSAPLGAQTAAPLPPCPAGCRIRAGP